MCIFWLWIDELDSNLKGEWTLLSSSIVPEDLPGELQKLFFHLDLYGEEALFRGGNGGIEDMEPIDLNSIG